MYKEEPIPLITYDPQSRSYGLSEEASAMICTIKNPIAVISVAGLYRTGKSYLLNRIILNRTNGFGVGPTVNPCTKGLWVWGTPINIGNVSVLIVDSEGTGALIDSDLNHDTRIFALAVLLGSTFVYNSVGSIDEGTLEALGLVVNLTKFVQLKSHDEPEQDEYQQFMPQFFWVLRDFSLQLLDSNGDQLTPNQYLERSLNEQPGFSDGVEEKNRIRRLLRTFFPDRDCCTLVRPVLDEDKLQALNTLDWKHLRQEFSDQALSFRKVLFSRVKPKQFKGKTLNGSMYVNLIRSYVQSINNGGVANIETAWSYVFKEECRKTQQEAQQFYESQLSEASSKLPTTEEGLKSMHRVWKQKAIQHMNKAQIGDVGGVEPYINELKAKIRQKFETLLEKNELESQQLCKQFLLREFAPIDRKLKESEYKTFTEFERDLKMFNAFLDEHGPKVQNNRQIFTDFLMKMNQEGAQFFILQTNQTTELIKRTSEDTINNLQFELQIIKAESNKLVEQQSTQIKTLQTLNQELKTKQQQIQLEFDDNRSNNFLTINNLKQEILEEQQRYQQLQDDMRAKTRQLEEQIRNQEREQFIQQSEQQKKEALLEQKITYLTKQMDEYTKKERSYDNTLNNSKNEFANKIREISSQYDQNIQELRQQNHLLNEKLQETSDALLQIEIKYDTYYQTSQQRDEQQQNLIKKLQTNNQQFQDQINMEIQRSKTLQDELICAQLKAENSDLIENFRIQLKQAETKLQEQKQLQLKQDAVLNQQIQFLQMELEEKKQSIIDLKKSHDQAIQAIELTQSSQTTQQQINKQILDLKEAHINEIRQIEQQNQQQRKQLQQQIDQLTQELQDLEMRSETFKSEKFKLQDELSEVLESQENLKLRLSQTLKDQDQNKYSLIKDKESRLNQRIKQLEDELTQTKQQLQQSVNNQQKNIEQQITELRNYYEMEKDVLERRIHEERQKADSKYQAIFEEQELKMREDCLQYEEEIEQLKDELRELELTLSSTQQQMGNEMELKNKSIQTLENIQQETKEQLVNLQQQFQSQLDSRTQNYTATINQLETQLNQYTFTAQTLQRENQQINQKIEQLENKIVQKTDELKYIKEDAEREKQALSEKYEDIKKKYMQVCDEYLEKKINYERAIALSSQQNDFFSKKVEELEKQLDVSNYKYEERIKLQKQEWTQELQEKLHKLNEDKQQTEQKISTMKKSIREKDTQILKLQQDLEKEVALSTEKIQYLESKLSEIEQQTSIDTITTSQQVKQLKETLSSQRLKSQQDIEQYRSQLNHVEFERQELMANYEKDKILWAGKFQFLESQRDQLKQEHADTLRKFEATIQTLQKQRNLERNDHNQDITEMLGQIERKYQDQVRDLQEQNHRKSDEYQEKIDRLERELKLMQNKEMLDQQGKLGSQYERKVAELLENEKRLLQQMDDLKQERDLRIHDHMDEMEQEKDYWKSKINELEDRLRESDKKHSQLIFFHEKERAKWNQEKDYILQQRNELQDSMQRLEKKKELLLRENEKIKNSSKSQRKYNPNQTYMDRSGLNSSYLQKNQISDKKISVVNSKDAVNMSYDVSKSMEEDTKEKENLSSSTFGSFKRYYQMMNSKQVSPHREQQ